MPIATNEIKLLCSASANSLGGAVTATAAGTSLFDKITGLEAATGRAEYRCIYVRNDDPALALESAVLSVQSDSTSPRTALAVGVGTASMNATEQLIGAETSAPVGVMFGTSAALGTIPAGQVRSAWIRRTVTAGAAALAADAATLRVTGGYSESGTGEPETFLTN